MSSQKSTATPYTKIVVDFLRNSDGHVGWPSRKRNPTQRTSPTIDQGNKSEVVNGFHTKKGRKKTMTEYEEIRELNQARPGWDRNARKQVKKRLQELGLKPSAIRMWMGETNSD